MVLGKTVKGLGISGDPSDLAFVASVRRSRVLGFWDF